MKSKTLLKLAALFLCAAALLPMIFACGEKPEEAASPTEAQGETPTPAPTPAPTDPPPPTDPPTTEAPIPPYEPDAALSYWENVEAEFAHYGLTGGVKCLPGEDEAALMKKFGANGTKKEELDVSGDGVPFSAAYSVTTAKDTVNFWDASYSCAIEKDLLVQEGDLVVGVLWVRGRRIAETEKFAQDDFPEYYMALKTATDNWATEGGVEPAREQFAEAEWQKVIFYGNVVNEESNSKNLQFQIFLGYGNQQVDFGGIAAYLFPWSRENEKAAIKLTY
ncbi:MAG: hypothetical protein FWD23_03455 [Oscillospiraceae bacterium]|nr:hypothetical protein [Oscillospiraceae bacterium]